MAEQQLDRAEIGAGLQQVNRERVAQRMRRNRLADAALQAHFPTGAIDGGWSDRLAGPITGKQPLSGMGILPIVPKHRRCPQPPPLLSRMGILPIVPEHRQQFGRQHDIAIFVALALVDPNDHALAIDRSGLEADGFGDLQTGGVTDGPKAVRLQASENGMITEERANALSDEDLVFLPGFSMAQEISDLSGRGVGTDVARNAITKINGEVSISSRKAEGTMVRLSLPLSMAVAKVMMVEVGDALFGVRMDGVAKTVRVPRSSIRMIKRSEVFVDGGQNPPLSGARCLPGGFASVGPWRAEGRQPSWRC